MSSNECVQTYLELISTLALAYKLFRQDLRLSAMILHWNRYWKMCEGTQQLLFILLHEMFIELMMHSRIEQQLSEEFLKSEYLREFNIHTHAEESSTSIRWRKWPPCGIVKRLFTFFSRRFCLLSHHHHHFSCLAFKYTFIFHFIFIACYLYGLSYEFECFLHFI